MTRVSVITPAFNVTKEQYKVSFNSIENQSNKDFEWIVVADGSGNTFYNDKYDDSFYADVFLSQNFGPSVARNAGFQISSGDIITYLDMGDELDNRRIENLISMYDSYDIEMTFSDYGIIEGYPNGFRFSHFDYIGRSSRYPDALTYIKLLDYQNISIPMGVSHTRRPFVEVGGFQRGIVCGEDGILWRRMRDVIEPAKILFSDDYAGGYHITQTGQSRTQRRFEMGGFAFDGSRNDNGRYLDAHWLGKFNSKGLYD